jgi:hypothetical protein
MHTRTTLCSFLGFFPLLWAVSSHVCTHQFSTNYSSGASKSLWLFVCHFLCNTLSCEVYLPCSPWTRQLHLLSCGSLLSCISVPLLVQNSQSPVRTSGRFTLLISLFSGGHWPLLTWKNVLHILSGLFCFGLKLQINVVSHCILARSRSLVLNFQTWYFSMCLLLLISDPVVSIWSNALCMFIKSRLLIVLPRSFFSHHCLTY